MREQMIKSDIIDCVIGLGPNLFFNSPMEACIIVCRTKKESTRGKSVLFINAINEVTRKNSESYLEEGHIQNIVQAYDKGKDIDSFCKLVPYKDIENNNFDLSIQKYIFINEEKSTVSLNINECLDNWETSHNKSISHYNTLIKML